jgi:hypothetical protein
MKHKAHMTVSVKPFGCMPSSGVSDGVQSIVTALHPEAIFCAVETSGEGAVNFQSRVQMFLFKARQRAQQELDQVFAQYGITREQAQAFLAQSPHYGNALYRAPHEACGSGADLIHRIGPLVGKSKLQQARVHARRALERAADVVREDIPAVAASARKVAPYLPSVGRWVASEGMDMVPGLLQGWRAQVEQWIRPSEVQQAEIERAAELAKAKAQPKATQARPETLRLQVMA